MLIFYVSDITFFPDMENGNFRIKDMYNHFEKECAQKASFLADGVYEIIMEVLIL